MESGRGGNRERIIEAARELFNERGAHAVTTNHIAAHLGISPGNLYYHFGNKEEIIRAIFPRFIEAAQQTIVLPRNRDVTAEDVGRYHLAGIEMLWEFRFLSRDPAGLMARDPSLTEAFAAQRKRMTGQFVAMFERLIAQGRMRRPDPPEDLARVATIALIVWSNWLHFTTSLQPDAPLEPGDIVEGAVHGFLAFAPYLEPGFAADVRAVFDTRALR